MNILITAINAKYIHSNLAAYSLKAYADKYQEHISVAEYTINHRPDLILQELYRRKPDVLCFSCYIWNISYVKELMAEFHKLLPGVPIWLGGPEVSFENGALFRQYPMLTGIIIGEGEGTFYDLCGYYIHSNRDKEDLAGIPGLIYNLDGKGKKTDSRKLLTMDALPFCYGELSDFKHRIVYYETSRGCPFHCSYCLSGIDKSLRFRSIGLVKKELLFFLEHKVRQVKFVDRTFNCNHGHAMSIWQFIKEHDNGITNFHFEISADLLTREEIDFIRTLRPGLFQLEIGVQSANPVTIREIKRSMDLERLETAVKSIKSAKNIHQHLDLIAGLPYEDFSSFIKSFDRIYRLYPQQLQLGFLKILKGSFLHGQKEEYGILYHEKPPYEVLSTKWLSYDDLLHIKLAEEMLEIYYNSGQFEMTMQVLELAFESPFHMYWELGMFYEKNGYSMQQHSRLRRYEILLEFVEGKDREHLELYKETLTFDLYLRENIKNRPGFAKDMSLFKVQARKLKGQVSKGKQMHIEPFYYDFSSLLEKNLSDENLPGKNLRGKNLPWYPIRKQEWEFYLFSYDTRDKTTGQAKVRRIIYDDIAVFLNID